MVYCSMTNEKQEHSESEPKPSEGFLRILKEVKAIDAKGIHLWNDEDYREYEKKLKQLYSAGKNLPSWFISKKIRLP
jgi:hypothetical protein